METRKPPIRVIAPGRLPADTVDATHHVPQLKPGVAEDCWRPCWNCSSPVFGADKDGLGRTLPFTEVSAEVDINCEMFKISKP
jgi:hypothetical protein